MKKVLFIGLVIISLFILFGCASELVNGKQDLMLSMEKLF
jgi:hypothetical protein